MIIAVGWDERDAQLAAGVLATPVVALADCAAALRAVRRAPAGKVVVVVGPGIGDRRLWRLAAEVRATRPAAAVVAVRAGADRLHRELTRQAGVTEVLPAGDPGAVAEVLRRLLGAPSGRMVTVTSGKGGCGATTLAVNLAGVLAAETSARVCLVDLDLRGGDVAITLGLEPLRTVASARAGEADVVAAVATPYRHRLDCVLAPVRPGEAERLEADGVGPVLDALLDSYDVVVVDTPPAINAPVLGALDRAERHVLVTSPERPALVHLRRTLDALDLLGHRKDRRSVVLNRSDSGVGLTAAEVEDLLHTPVAAHVPSSRDVPASVNRRRPLVDASPDHPVSVAIRDLALRRPAPAARPSSVGGAMR